MKKTTNFVSIARALTAHYGRGWLDRLSPLELDILAWDWYFWMRPDQKIPMHHWRILGMSGGRGFGKSLGIATYINHRVASGEEVAVGLMAPTEARVEQVQIKALVETAPPWNRPSATRMSIRWPNGVEAIGFTPEAPGRSRSENLSLTWTTEIVDWNQNTRLEAFNNLSTATRIGRAQMIWDSTSKGSNDVLSMLRANNQRDPITYPIIGGSTFSNPLLSTQYLQAQWVEYGTGIRRREELFGESFEESEGALWRQAWIDRHRVALVQEPTDMTIVGVDPAQSTHDTSDETGIIVGERGTKSQHAYITRDLSGKHSPDEWGDLVLGELPNGGYVTIERNHLGDNAVYVLRSRATDTGLTIVVIGRDDPWPPPATEVIFVREVVSRESKGDRAAGPSAETEAGRVHLVGNFPDLEKELTTWVPGRGRSPNRLDAAAFAITEIRGLNQKPKKDGTKATADAVAANQALAQAIRNPSLTTMGGRGRGRPSRNLRF